jgi:hypothetical protein
MKDQDYIPKTLMPTWWQLSSTVLLYAAYLLWLLPVVLYFQDDGTALTAGLWLAGVIVVQFVLVKAIALIEYVSTANKIERLRAAEDGLAHTGDKK